MTGQHLVPIQDLDDHPNKRRKVSVVVPPPSISPRKAIGHTSLSTLTSARTERTGSASSSPDPLTTPQHDRLHIAPASSPSNPRQPSPRVAIIPVTKPTIVLPSEKKEYVPRSRSPPIILRGPSTASPSYGQERIVERVYQGTSGKFCYRVERRVRRYTQPEQLASEQKRTADLSSARQFLGQDDSSTDGTSTIGGEVDRNGSKLDVNGARSGTSTSKAEDPTTFLVPPQFILEDVSAAELEAFENAFVRRQNAEEEAERRAIEEERRRKMEERARLMDLAREERAKMKMAQRVARGLSAGTTTPTDGELFDDTTDPNERRKRKAGLQAADQLAATPWIMKALKGLGNDELLNTPPASDTPKKRGRPKGWRKGHPMGYAAFKTVAEATSTTASSNVTPAPVNKGPSHGPSTEPVADEEYEIKRLVSVRPSLKKSSRRQFMVEWEGYPGEDTWQDEEDLPDALVRDFDRLHASTNGLAEKAAQLGELTSGMQPKGQALNRSISASSEQLQPVDMDEHFLAAIFEHERLKREQQHNKPASSTAHSRTGSEDPRPDSVEDANIGTVTKPPLAPPIADEQSSDELEYEIEAIVNDVIEQGVRFFEVEWVGYPGDNTWQTEEQLPFEAVLDYLQNKGELAIEARDEDNVDDNTDARSVDDTGQAPAAAAPVAGKGEERLTVADDITEHVEEDMDDEQLTSKTSIFAAWGLPS